MTDNEDYIDEIEQRLNNEDDEKSREQFVHEVLDLVEEDVRGDHLVAPRVGYRLLSEPQHNHYGDPITPTAQGAAVETRFTTERMTVDLTVEFHDHEDVPDLPER